MTREGWLERVREEGEKIIAAEGHLTVKGRYYAHEADAVLQRRWEAEVRASRAIARDIRRGRGCNWCGQPIRADQETVSAAGAEIHRVPCSVQFAAFTGETPRKPLEDRMNALRAACRRELAAAWPADSYKPWMRARG
jgi:hypothetical protein